MKLDHDLSFLNEISKSDLKSISGGGNYRFNRVGSFEINRGDGTQISSEGGSSSSASSSAFGFSRNGVSTGGGRSSRKITVNGKVIKSEDKSFSFGPVEGPFRISIESSVD